MRTAAIAKPTTPAPAAAKVQYCLPCGVAGRPEPAITRFEGDPMCQACALAARREAECGEAPVAVVVSEPTRAMAAAVDPAGDFREQQLKADQAFVDLARQELRKIDAALEELEALNESRNPDASLATVRRIFVGLHHAKHPLSALRERFYQRATRKGVKRPTEGAAA